MSWHPDCSPSPLVSLKRLRAYATVIAVTCWAIWAVNFSHAGPLDRVGKPKATDFIQFYVAGSFAREGRLIEYYDLRTSYARARAVAPGAEETLYLPVQSPLVAIVFSPMAALSYPAAAAIWILIIVVCYGGACWLLWGDCAGLRPYGREAALVAIAFGGLFSTVLHGQTSAVSLLAFTAALCALRRDRKVGAGLALGCLVFKPHWVLAAAAVFGVAREWRVVIGIATSAAAELAVAYASAGAAAMRAYWSVIASILRVGDPVEASRVGDTLRNFFVVFVPHERTAYVLYVAAAVLTLYVAAKIWRSQAAFEVRASAAILAMILVSPHVFAYDLIVTAPLFFLLSNWSTAGHTLSRPVFWTLGALFVAPLVAGLPAPIHLQFSVTAMVVLLFSLRRMAQERLAAEMVAVSV